MKFSSRVLWLSLLLVMDIATGFALLHQGLYGFLLFLVVPFVFGMLAVLIVRPETVGVAAAVGATSLVPAFLAVILAGVDGLVCIAMALPLSIGVACAGGVVGFWMARSHLQPRSGAAMLMIPVAAFTWDVSAPPASFHVTTGVIVQAKPEQVWEHVIGFPKLPEPKEWIFRTGLAYPIEARIEGRGLRSVRYCQFSTGPFVEPITVWDRPHLLRFRVTQNPAPLKEWSPWGNIHPKHLHSYLVSEQGQFELTPLPGGRTLLSGTTWYRHSLWPAEYWRGRSDAVIHRIHARVLEHVKSLSERDAHVTPAG